MLQIKRTEGVSTTDIVGRMLTCTRVNPHMTKESDSQVGGLAMSTCKCIVLIFKAMHHSTLLMTHVQSSQPALQTVALLLTIS